MKRLASLLVVLAGLFSLPALAAKDAVNTKGFGNSAAIKGYDSVAYFTVGAPVKGSKNFKTEWRGAEWRFSSAENLDLFKNAPEKYAPQYGGYCAWAMAGGKTAGIDPDQWHIRDGKLYLNYNANVKKEWLTTIEQDIIDANKNYPEITDVNTYN